MVYAGFIIRYFDSKNGVHWSDIYRVYQDVLNEQKRLIEAGMHAVTYYRLVEELNQHTS